MRSRTHIAAVLVLAASLACEGEEEEGPLMSPGQDCLSCHGGFTVAGTIFAAGTSQGAPGLTVHVAPSTGAALELTTNAAGNFFTHAPVVFPAAISVTDGTTTVDMVQDADSGACNACHGGHIEF
jgi:hypothetical protein